MLTTMIVPAAATARAVASSPSGWARRWNAVGATNTGIDAREPSSVTPSSRSPPPRSTRGTSRSAPNAVSFSRSVISSSAPPAK
jgi:hypothetical protein